MIKRPYSSPQLFFQTKSRTMTRCHKKTKLRKDDRNEQTHKKECTQKKLHAA